VKEEAGKEKLLSQNDSLQQAPTTFVGAGRLTYYFRQPL